MNEQPLDLRRVIRAILRHWLLVLALLWGGCAAGYLLASRQQQVYVARSSVLLPPAPVDEDGTRVRNINTQVNIATNGNILQRAGQVVDPPLSARTMRKRIKVKALTADILEVRAEAASGGDAARLADAVAKEYVAEATSASSLISGTAISGLEAQAARVEARRQETTTAIEAETGRLARVPPNSTERARLVASIDGLVKEQREASSQLASLTDRIAEARLQDQLNREATRLLAPAIRPSGPARPNPLLFTAGGGLLGLVVAAALSLFLFVRDHRLRTRSAISGVVAAPVLASLEVPRRVSTHGCMTMLQHWEPRPMQAWALRQACLRLGLLHRNSPSHILVVGLAGDTAGPLVAVQLAVFTASMGIPTALVVDTPHPSAARVRAACLRGDRGQAMVRPSLFTRAHGPGGSLGQGRQQATLTITFAIATVRELSAVSKAAVTTLAVSSGFADADSLATAALTCVDAGHPITGVFLANPDPSDPTTGEPVARPSTMLALGEGEDGSSAETADGIDAMSEAFDDEDHQEDREASPDHAGGAPAADANGRNGSASRSGDAPSPAPGASAAGSGMRPPDNEGDAFESGIGDEMGGSGRAAGNEENGRAGAPLPDHAGGAPAAEEADRSVDPPTVISDDRAT